MLCRCKFSEIKADSYKIDEEIFVLQPVGITCQLHQQGQTQELELKLGGWFFRSLANIM